LTFLQSFKNNLLKKYLQIINIGRSWYQIID
jgi:hypothetical protein